jgi:L-ascorbate metabolism protein UlaG (beta-lactamase superfamily)
MKMIIPGVIIIGIMIMILSETVAPAITHPDLHRVNRIAQSPNFKDGRFMGAVDALTMSAVDIAATTWAFLFRRNDRTPATPLPWQPVDIKPFLSRQTGQLSVTWLGHSSMMINADGFRILTDPVFAKCVSILGPKRFNGDLPLDPGALPQIDLVIISHDHYDHLDKAAIQQLRDKVKVFAVPLAVGARLEKWGIPQWKIIELDWWEECRLDENLMVAATPAQHFSGRGITDRNKTLWASWVILTPFHRLFFSGDSGFFNGFKKVGDKYGPFDMTFIECGAYGTAWPKVHMFPEQTVQAHLDLRGRLLQPIHWGTFNLALHPWYEPMERLVAAAADSRVDIATPVVGETVIYGKTAGTQRWWQRAMAQHSNAKKKTIPQPFRVENR